jgi:toxin HigB-1
LIQSFGDRDTEGIFRGERTSRYASFRAILERKLTALDEAESLRDLSSVPGHRLEQLKGKRRGEYSIRINNQWRLVFRWTVDGPHNVKVEDYH